MNQQAKALRTWVAEQGLRGVARELGCSTECISRYIADVPGMHVATIKLIERALADRDAEQSKPERQTRATP